MSLADTVTTLADLALDVAAPLLRRKPAARPDEAAGLCLVPPAVTVGRRTTHRSRTVTRALAVASVITVLGAGASWVYNTSAQNQAEHAQGTRAALAGQVARLRPAGQELTWLTTARDATRGVLDQEVAWGPILDALEAALPDGAGLKSLQTTPAGAGACPVSDRFGAATTLGCLTGQVQLASVEQASRLATGLSRAPLTGAFLSQVTPGPTGSVSFSVGILPTALTERAQQAAVQATQASGAPAPQPTFPAGPAPSPAPTAQEATQR